MTVSIPHKWCCYFFHKVKLSSSHPPNKNCRDWHFVVLYWFLLCVGFFVLCCFAFIFVLLLTKKNFDFQVNSLGRGYLLLILWHQNLMISVQKDKLIVMQSFSFFLTNHRKWVLAQTLENLTGPWPLKAGI